MEFIIGGAIGFVIGTYLGPKIIATVKGWFAGDDTAA